MRKVYRAVKMSGGERFVDATGEILEPDKLNRLHVDLRGVKRLVMEVDGTSGYVTQAFGHTPERGLFADMYW